LLSGSGHPLSNQELRDINADVVNDFDAAVKALLEGTYVLRSGGALNRFQRDVAIAYGLRNFAAHDPSTVPNHLGALSGGPAGTVRRSVWRC
jgi:hypothetical protein